MKSYPDLLLDFEKVSDKLTKLIQFFPVSKIEDVVFDKWSLKNVVSHLNHWIIHDIDCIKSLIAGKVPHWEPDIEVFNTRGVDKRRDLNWDIIFNEFLKLKNELLNLYKNLGEEYRHKKIWPDKNETPYKFLNEDIKHWQGEHISQLEEYFKKNK
jgi:hypothetical protein